ncbi:PmoA family protein [Allonocardiopsis opalescens]|uniref:Methane monooxygenase PmoA-like n=1 Tax=Allonocardiopsis opalescens TaxID=1144618 RepID=A0A2T0QAQ2_9ACTN|nr:PmoA family protein [Allonocardiopsis opalescens]PRY00890.1 methane monooxygenase PmoA-like [Allonocardiopsis opalescens]
MTSDTSARPAAPVQGADSTEPAPSGLGLVHELDRSLRIGYGGTELTRYVYRPWDVQLESPRPYFHPLRTLGGDLVSLYRPHDHVWHKGIAWSLPNVGPANFWGGPTYLRDRGYQQLDNDGATVHRAFDRVSADGGAVEIAHRLDWVTQQGETWFTETRSVRATVQPDQGAWTLVFDTEFTNRTGAAIRIGSPTTEGRENAGYGGLFWRGPRSFSNGTVYTPDAVGRDELMGVRAPWMAYAGRHDDHDRSSTLVFVDEPANLGHPVKWFVRTNVFACVCPAPFFDEEVPAEPGVPLRFRYAVVIADGDRGRDGSGTLAETGRSQLAEAAAVRS